MSIVSSDPFATFATLMIVLKFEFFANTKYIGDVSFGGDKLDEKGCTYAKCF